MRTRRVVAITGALAALLAAVTSAQSPGDSARGPAVPKTPWGDPDLQGTYSSEAELSVPFERQAQYGERRFLTDAEYTQRRTQADKQLASDNSDFDIETSDRSNAGAVGSATSPPPHWLERGKVSRRTSLVIDPPDGRLPPLAQQRQAAGRGRGAGGAGTFAGLGAFGATAIVNGPEDLSLWERCISRGIPGATFPTVYNANLRIVQGPGAVAITYEMIHDTRVIPIGTAAHVGTAIRGYNGDSRAHWEGNTLVVDTTNFSEKTNFRGSRETLHIVERFTREGDGINYEVTVNDPSVWTKPWTAALTLGKQPDDTLFEYACHEGNNSMRNILSGSRAAEKAK
jgi:hypothetical protein